VAPLDKAESKVSDRSEGSSKGGKIVPNVSSDEDDASNDCIECVGFTQVQYSVDNENEADDAFSLSNRLLPTGN
jgi:hypothetical protein